MTRPDLIVVGAGHAGCEAAAAAARLGLSVWLVTLDRRAVGRLSCNPAIGGLAKGHLVRELDALGGLMGRVADASCVQFRRLNTRKGLAVRSSRAQVDIHHYPHVLQQHLARIPNLRLIEDEVVGVRVQGGAIAGVHLASAGTVACPRVILTTGTFLGGTLHTGEERREGGREGDRAAHRLSEDLRALGLPLFRLKTGTVPRVHRATVAWDQVEPQDDTCAEGRMSWAEVPRDLSELPCHMTWTHSAVHDLISANLHRSAMYAGHIEGTGPRYCPSVEDKIVRFPDRDRHLLFLEPEGHQTDRVYIAGLSTSLPRDVQDAMVAAIPGLEHAQILQYGYAVEYDVSDPRQLDHGLQHRHISGLWLAGQVNGTSGYEEAAVQGFVAGVSAARGEPLRLGREEAYIGVLIDDLVTRGVGGEPYRMFPSRAEHRLRLREDTADRRLMPTGRSLGLVDDPTWAAFEARQDALRLARDVLQQQARPTPDLQRALEARDWAPLKKPVAWADILARPDVEWTALRELKPEIPPLDPELAETLTHDIRYAGYIAAAERRAETTRKMRALRLPTAVDWSEHTFLSSEVRERLARAQPATLADAATLPGVTPAALDAIATWLAHRARHASRPAPPR